MENYPDEQVPPGRPANGSAESRQASVERQDAQRDCPYCGALLNPDFYFCLACATPWQSPDSVVPRLVPRRLTEGERIGLRAPHVAGLVWTFVAVVVASGIVSYALFGLERMDLVLVFQSVALFITTCIFAARHWPCLAVQLRCVGLFRPAALLALLALAPLLAVNYYYHTWLVDSLGVERVISPESLRESGLGRGALVFLLCVCPAILEEVAFRGLVQHWLAVAVSPMRALLIASALFTAMHFSPISAPYLFAVGMLLGWAKWKTGSLYPSMLIHFLHNWVVIEWF